MVDTTLPGVFLKGTAAARPAANAVAWGTVYSATDTGVITQSDGVSTWTTWATISSGMADPMTTRGDIIYRDAANATSRLGRGSAGTVLGSDGTDVSYVTPKTVATDVIWDAAGDLAVGSGADTAARLALGAAGGHVSRINGAVAWNSGTANPTATTGDRYWRTDLGLEVYYDGTRWLSTTLYRIELAGPFDGDATAANNGWPNAVNGKNTSRTALWHTDFAIWLVSLYGGTFVGTTNDGSNYWTGSLSGGVTSTAYGNFTTAADSPNVHTGHKTALDQAAGSTERVINFAYTKTGAPGSIYGPAGVTYRLIVT